VRSTHTRAHTHTHHQPILRWAQQLPLRGHFSRLRWAALECPGMRVCVYVCVCVCVCVRVCVCTCVCGCRYTAAYTWARVPWNLYIYVYFVHILEYPGLYNIYTYMYIYMIYIYSSYIYIYIYTYIYIYIPGKAIQSQDGREANRQSRVEHD